MNNRGADKVLSVYWFVVLFIVAGGVVYMVAVFYGTPYDVREVEANLLINKVADCVATGGSLNENFGKIIDETTLLQICEINFNVEDEFSWRKQDQYYINLSYSKFDSVTGEISDSKDKAVTKNSILLDNCGGEGTHFAFCIERGFYVSDGNVIKIFVAVKKVDKNV